MNDEAKLSMKPRRLSRCSTNQKRSEQATAESSCDLGWQDGHALGEAQWYLAPDTNTEEVEIAVYFKPRLK